MNDKENIAGAIESMLDGDTLGATEAIQAVMASKIEARLDDMRVEVAQKLFNGDAE